MSFLSELKKLANALQQHRHRAQHKAAASPRSIELACQVALRYLQDLGVQLNIIKPPAVGGFEVLQRACPSFQVNQALLDELAKTLVGRPSRIGQ